MLASVIFFRIVVGVLSSIIFWALVIRESIVIRAIKKRKFTKVDKRERYVLDALA